MPPTAGGIFVLQYYTSDKQARNQWRMLATSELDFIMAGFIPPKKQPNDKTTPFHTYCACKLLEGVKDHLTKSYSIKRWAKEFAILDRELNGDTDRIDDVLTWYVSNFTDKYTPKAISGSGFRAKFLSIEAAMQRMKPAIIEIEVTQQAKDIVKRLLQLRWPKGSEKQLPAMVQLSLNNYRSFYAHLRKDTRSASSYLHLRLPAPTAYVTEFYIQLHAQVSTWDQWSGKLSAVEINDRFKNYCTDILSHYSKNATHTTDKLMKGYHEGRDKN